jgi:hypothetical protein
MFERPFYAEQLVLGQKRHKFEPNVGVILVMYCAANCRGNV